MGIILDELLRIKDDENARFQAKLTPAIKPETCLGTRVPELRKLAVRLEKCEEYSKFMADLPHTYYDENMLHSIFISRVKDYETCLSRVEAFLPYVDNWAVCDTLRPKVFAKHTDKLLPKIIEWTKSSETYTIRFGVDMLMTYYLDKEFKPEYNEIPASIISDEYYVNMMLAWYYATALAKQWDATIPYLEENRLSVWVHNKTIQKARESFRITSDEKDYLKTLKR